MHRTWHSVPTAIRVVVVGLLAGYAGSLPWSRMVAANLYFLPDIPWAVPVMAMILSSWWLYFVRGRGWPAGTSAARRLLGRANPVPDHMWGPALGTGMLGLFSILAFQGVMARLVTLPRQQEIDPALYPLSSVVAWAFMSALVAGVIEETAFRGYIQGGIERRHGLGAAILVTGCLFGVSHFAHPEVGIVLLPYYIGVAAVYGLLAAATNSTYPSMLLHAGGNMFSLFSLFAFGRSEWQVTPVPAATIWQTGVDAAFLGSLAFFALAGAVAAFAYRGLFRVAKPARPNTDEG